jgi:YidC/Oxa1 family membrane protein insertase
MDKKQILGFVLIFALLIIMQIMNKPTEEQKIAKKKMQDSIAMVEKQKAMATNSGVVDSSITSTQNQGSSVINDSLTQQQTNTVYGPFAGSATGTEKEVVLENEDIKITFSTKGGRITKVWLKKYTKWLEDKNHNKVVEPLELLNYPKDKFEYILPVKGAQNNKVKTTDLYFKSEISDNQVKFYITGANNVSFTQVYKLKDKGFHIDYTVSHSGLDISEDNKIKFVWDVYLGKLEKAYTYEKRYSALFYKDMEEVDHLSYMKSDDIDKKGDKIEWVSNVNQFFNSTLMKVTEDFTGSSFEQIVPDDKEKGIDYLKICKTRMFLPENNKINMAFYIGPNEFDNLKAYNNDLEMIIPFGWNIFGAINRWVIRPMFLFFSNILGSMGLGIILLIFIIKGLLYPLNYKMLLSSTKMAVLKPEIQKIKDKYKDDSQQVQVKTMELYRKYGVSPFGGCLPMILQMPIWFALFRFFPAAIEFRHVPFLWADDLSSYEAIAYLPFNIPMYGEHVSLFALLWGISSVIYAHYNMKNMDMGTTQNPAMKYMQYVMPLFFIVFFNSYASGLTVYMFFSNLFTIAQTIITKKFILDEDKIRQKLELKKAKPKKKSKFAQRLEEAMKQQQAAAEQKKKGKK